jgi:hypothetical protein
MNLGQSGGRFPSPNDGTTDVRGNGGPGAYTHITGKLEVLAGGGNCHMPGNRQTQGFTNGRQGVRIDGFSTDAQDNSAGGGLGAPPGRSSNGGSGIVIIRYRYKD